MNSHQIKIALKEAGFWLKRQGSRHELWTNGKETLAISSNPRNTSPRTYKSMLSKLHKAKYEHALG